MQMQLPQKPKSFYWIFILRFKFTETFEHFEEKYEPHSLSISEIIPSEKRGYLNVLKGPVSERPVVVNVLTVRNTAEIYTAALWSNFTIILRQIKLENFSLSHI